MQSNKNFQNRAFEEVFESITANMPSLVFFGIILTYMITAALNIYFLPLPPVVSIPAAIAIQFGRFSIVFMDFLNPTGQRSKWPPIVATIATVVAVVELAFSVQDIQIADGWNAARYWSVFLFGAMLIFSGYILEINFIEKGAEAYGMTSKKTTKQVQQVQVKAQPRNNVEHNGRAVIAGFMDAGKRNSVQEDNKAAIKAHRATLRVYRNRQKNGIGNPVTVQAGIDRSVQKLRELGVEV